MTEASASVCLFLFSTLLTAVYCFLIKHLWRVLMIWPVSRVSFDFKIIWYIAEKDRVVLLWFFFFADFSIRYREFTFHKKTDLVYSAMTFFVPSGSLLGETETDQQGVAYLWLKINLQWGVTKPKGTLREVAKCRTDRQAWPRCRHLKHYKLYKLRR